MDDYFRATPDERARIDKQRPPIAHTHRGKPRAWEMGGYHEATKTKRTPTHRAPGAPVAPAWAQHLLAANGKDTD